MGCSAAETPAHTVESPKAKAVPAQFSVNAEPAPLSDANVKDSIAPEQDQIHDAVLSDENNDTGSDITTEGNGTLTAAPTSHTATPTSDVNKSYIIEENSSINDSAPDELRVTGQIICQGRFDKSKEISAQQYFENLEDQYREVKNRDTYSYTSPNGSIARNGPYNTWFYEMANNTASEVYPRQFDSIKVGDHIILEEDYINYMDSLCKANIDGDRRLPQIALEKLLNWTNWGGHASNWPSFDYIETDNKIIESPSPKGLEHYTKYTTTSGVIIVGGQSVPDAAMLAARESVEYMLSMRPDFVDILKSNEARISLFGPNNDVSELPEFPDENEPGGFAMGMTDATMTANAGWLCYEGNWDTGGNPVIHELVHSINHLVFEQINEVYFYERIYSLANSAIDRGIFPPFEQNLPEGEEQDISHRVGEYWAMTVEGYIMNRAGFKNSHDTRDWISENDPELLDLIHKYYPTDEWSYCSGVENTY